MNEQQPSTPESPVVNADGIATGDTSRALATAPDRSRERAGAIPADARESLGRIVHGQRLAFKTERGRRIPSSWEGRDPRLRELDMRIGYAVANYALAENAATYGISCASCAAYLDRANTERERAEAAEAKLAEIRSVLLESAATVRCHILAITGTEEGTGNGR